MMTVEREISSIETANINKETLDAMKNAQQAMKRIHGNLTIDKVDQTMQDLEEQHAIGEEIADALTSRNAASGIDEGELEDELEAMEQEELDNKMLKAGGVPVADQVQRLPAAGNTEREFFFLDVGLGWVWGVMLTDLQSKGSNEWRKMTRKRSCGSCRLRWLCDIHFVSRWRAF